MCCCSINEEQLNDLLQSDTEYVKRRRLGYYFKMIGSTCPTQYLFMSILTFREVPESLSDKHAKKRAPQGPFQSTFPEAIIIEE